jgi:hypothetical protein
MSLLTDINAFFADHLRCGGLKFGVEGPIGWLASARGAGTNSSRSTFDMTAEAGRERRRSPSGTDRRRGGRLGQGQPVLLQKYVGRGLSRAQVRLQAAGGTRRRTSCRSTCSGQGFVSIASTRASCCGRSSWPLQVMTGM